MASRQDKIDQVKGMLDSYTPSQIFDPRTKDWLINFIDMGNASGAYAGDITFSDILPDYTQQATDWMVTNNVTDRAEQQRFFNGTGITPPSETRMDSLFETDDPLITRADMAASAMGITTEEFTEGMNNGNIEYENPEHGLPGFFGDLESGLAKNAELILDPFDAVDTHTSPGKVLNDPINELSQVELNPEGVMDTVTAVVSPETAALKTVADKAAPPPDSPTGDGSGGGGGGSGELMDIAKMQAEEQRRLLGEQTNANRMDQTGPFGTVSYDRPTWNPETGQYEGDWGQTTELSERQAAMLEGSETNTMRRQQMEGALATQAKHELSPMDYSGLTEREGGPTPTEFGALTREFGDAPVPGQFSPTDTQTDLDFSGAFNVGDPTAIRDRAEKAIYDRTASRLDPQYEQRANDLEIQLRNQGLRPGDEAYDRAVANFNRDRTDAYQAANNEAIMGGGQESTRLFGQEMERRQQDVGETTSQGTFSNAAAQQMFAQLLAGGKEGFNQAATSTGIMDQQRRQEMAELLGMSATEFDQAFRSASFGNANRESELAELLGRRNQALNEVNSVASGTQTGFVNPLNYTTAGQGQAPNYLSAASQDNAAALAQSNANAANQQSKYQGIFDLGTNIFDAWSNWGGTGSGGGTNTTTNTGSNDGWL